MTAPRGIREESVLRVWIDATRQPELRVFGMSLLERLLCGIARAGLSPSELRVELAPDTPIPTDLPPGLEVSWSREGGSNAQRLGQALRDAAGEPLLALSADTVVDTRLLAQLGSAAGSRAFVGGEGERRAAVLRLEAELAESVGDATDLLALAERSLAAGAVKEFSGSDFDSYIVNLRRDLPAYAWRVFDAASRDAVEYFLFWSNYKGSTDFLTRWVYPPLVWQMVRPLAARRVHPNWVTAVAWVATIGAIPFFAAGMWVPGLFLAYGMSVLDSVDGKLARLTFTYSRFGDVFDHGLDIVHPPFWYLAWGWALGGGVATSGEYQASLWMFGLYVADRLCAPVFKWRTGRSIHGITPLDERFRTFISRRNVNLAVFTVALLVDALVPRAGLASPAFYAIVAWQGVCLVWHALRVVQFSNHYPSQG